MRKGQKKQAPRGYCTGAALAEQHGVSTASITKWTKAGKLKRSTNGFYNVRAAQQQIAKLLEASSTQGEKGASTAPRWRDKKGELDIQRAEIALKRELGELVEKSVVQAEALAAYRRVKVSMLQIPDRVTAEVAALNDFKQIRLLLRREIEGALRELAEQFEADVQ